MAARLNLPAGKSGAKRPATATPHGSNKGNTEPKKVSYSNHLFSHFRFFHLSFCSPQQAKITKSPPLVRALNAPETDSDDDFIEVPLKQQSQFKTPPPKKVLTKAAKKVVPNTNKQQGKKK